MWINGATTFSVKPLRISALLGIVFAMIGFVGACVVVMNKVLHPDMMAGWSSLICVILLVGGILLISLGTIGEYIGRIYLCINKTPQYVVRDFENGISGSDESMSRKNEI